MNYVQHSHNLAEGFQPTPQPALLNKSRAQGDPVPDDRRLRARPRRPHDGPRVADAQAERRLRGARRRRLRRLFRGRHLGIRGDFWWVDLQGLRPQPMQKSRSPMLAGSFSDWESEDDLSGLYCPPTPFYAAFVSLVCFWVVMPLLFLCHCCAMCHKMTSGSVEVVTIS